MGGVLGFGQESNLCFKPDPGRVHGLHAHGVVLLAYRGAAAEGGGLPERDGHVGGRVVPDEGMFNMPNNYRYNILSILIFLKDRKWIKIFIKILLILTQNPKCQYINYLSTYQTSLSRWADGQTRARGSFGGRSSVSEPPHLSFTDVFF